jgi:hypothetical protein
VRRFSAIILCLFFLSLGSGLLERFHVLIHEAQDALLDQTQGNDTPQPHHHDEDQCSIAVQLHMPLLSVGWVPLLISLGLLIAFLTQLPVHRPDWRFPASIDCRGPPLA